MTGSSPHIIEGASPLEVLAMRALRRYGDFHPGTVDGDVILMFIDFANEILQDLRGHPYWSTPIEDYTSQTETRPVPDNIIVTGLLYRYAIQQMSAKAPVYERLYFQTMNQTLWNLLNGNTRLRLRVVDGTPTNETNGLPRDEAAE
jgi:hypothetical protein